MSGCATQGFEAGAILQKTQPRHWGGAVFGEGSNHGECSSCWPLAIPRGAICCEAATRGVQVPQPQQESGLGPPAATAEDAWSTLATGHQECKAGPHVPAQEEIHRQERCSVLFCFPEPVFSLPALHTVDSLQGSFKPRRQELQKQIQASFHAFL